MLLLLKLSLKLLLKLLQTLLRFMTDAKGEALFWIEDANASNFYKSKAIYDHPFIFSLI